MSIAIFQQSKEPNVTMLREKRNLSGGFIYTHE